MRKRTFRLQPYRGLSGSSGVKAYGQHGDSLALQFQDKKVYLYDRTRPGVRHVAAMKKLSPTGRGLTTYVNQHVRSNYVKKLKLIAPNLASE
jgi:hypothetical protein